MRKVDTDEIYPNPIDRFFPSNYYLPGIFGKFLRQNLQSEG
jgi:hypothetical protein